MATIQRLQLRQFRNYDLLDIELTAGMNLFVGCNGQGKSNILEAVSYLGLLRSFRGSQPDTMRQWGAPFFSVKACLSTADARVATELSAVFGEKRSLHINGGSVARASEFINQFLCVSLVPEDIDLVKGSAKGRRRFLDMLLTQSDRYYLHQLQCYLQALRSRNAILRQMSRFPASALRAYDTQLLKYGVFVEAARVRCVKRIQERLSSLSEQLLGEGMLGVKYLSSVGIRNGEEALEKDIEVAFATALEKAAERDRREGHTSVGPHRSDFICSMDSRSLSSYGSEGECRLMSLALRLASMGIIQAADFGDRGIVLLVDDVTGELDPLRKRLFYDMIGQADQVFLTATTVSDELVEKSQKLFAVEKGKVRVERG